MREYFPPQEAGTRLGIVLMATLVGMALGGWMSGVIFDLTGSYQAAFLNGLGWNLVNVAIVAGCCCARAAGRCSPSANLPAQMMVPAFALRAKIAACSPRGGR